MMRPTVIDTHTHLYAVEFEADQDLVIQRALQAGVKTLVLPNIDCHSIAGLLKLCTAYPQHIKGMMGLHPCSVGPNFHQDLHAIREVLFSGDFVAVGEIGMDLYWDKSHQVEQALAFRTQVGWAKELGLPINIHSRDAFEAIQAELMHSDFSRDWNPASGKGIFHCFTGTIEQARWAVEHGFLLGIGGVITYKNSHLPEVVKSVGLEHLVLETDAPYLPPVPYRGKRNESSFIVQVLYRVAECLGIMPEEVAARTTANAIRVYGIADAALAV
jgi:TatD DNase family protein